MMNFFGVLCALLVISVGAAGKSAPRCRVDPKLLSSQDLLGEKVQLARNVFTGRIVGKLIVDTDDVRRFKVEIKRMMKGPKLTGIVEVIRRTLPYNHTCSPVIRDRQTAIFFVTTNAHPDQELALILDPVPVNLQNLDRINAAVKGAIYVPRPPIIEEPCERKYCQWNADCRQVEFDVDPTGAVCECPSQCQVDYNPVCGSDNVTYTSRCVMRKESCDNLVAMHVKYEGECDSPVNYP